MTKTDACARWCVRCLALAVIVGCSSSSQPPPAASGPQIPGYNHTQAHSKCRLGPGVTMTTDSGFKKWVGQYGVFAVDAVNASATCVQDATAPSATFNLAEAAHDQAVTSYFESAGLPADQVGGVSAVSSGGSGGPGGITSNLARQVKGTPVAESVASAELDAAGEALFESVYWPALPGSVAQDAAALDQIVGDPVALSKYQAMLPAGLPAGTVVIHHSSLFVRSVFVAYACYDVPSQAGTRHFLKDGSEIRLPQETGAP